MAEKLKFGTSKGTGYTRANFPTHLGVAKGPLNKMSDFDSTFARERDKQGPGGEFTYKGKRYTTDRADDKPGQKKKTAISESGAKDKKTLDIQKMESQPLNPIPNPGSKMEPIKTGKTFEQIQAEGKAEKQAAKKQKRQDFREGLSEGLVKAGAMISGAHGKGGSGSMSEESMKYDLAQQQLEKSKINNERRAYLASQEGKYELGGDGDKGVKSQNDLSQEIQQTNVSAVEDTSHQENLQQSIAARRGDPNSPTCPSYG